MLADSGNSIYIHVRFHECNLSHFRCFSSVFRCTSILVAMKPGFDAYNKCYNNIGTRGDGDHM